MALQRDLPVFLAGHRGLVGSAMLRRLRAAGFSRLLTVAREELDLRDGAAVGRWFAAERPAVVLLCAARVGGILANASTPVPFLLENLQIQNAVISAAHASGVEQLLFLGSSCIYPRDCAQPIREDALLTGPLEATNRPYAIAKIAGIELCWALNRQFGRRYLALMPTNLFGPGDSYDLATSHVLPALIRRMHEAREADRETVTLWGTGTPRREFLYSDDLADAALHLLDLPGAELAALFNEHGPPLLNVGTGKDLTIAELAARIAAVVGYRGRIEWDRDKPDGTPRKLLDVSRLRALGWAPRTGLTAGIEQAHAAFVAGHVHHL